MTRQQECSVAAASSASVPEMDDRTIAAVDRVLARSRDADAANGAVVLTRRTAAFLVFPERRIGTDDEQVLAAGEPLMAGAGGQHRHIARFEVEHASAIAAEPHPGAAARDAEHLVDARVVMRVVIDAVAPGLVPSVASEKLLKHGGRIKAVRQPDRAAVKH